MSVSTPRANQKRWVDERIVIETVTKCIANATFLSMRPNAVQEYARLLRYYYGYVSFGGTDVDAGIRALNYIHKIHKEASGKKELWFEVLQVAKKSEVQDAVKPLSGMEIPAYYK